MKDIKNILIVILLAGCMIFGFMWFFNGSSEYKQKIKQLEKEKKELVAQRDSLNTKANLLEIEYLALKKKEARLIADLEKLEDDIKKSKIAAARSQAELNKMKHDLKDTQDKIAELKQHPANRTGDDLLNSLKMKTQKQ